MNAHRARLLCLSVLFLYLHITLYHTLKHISPPLYTAQKERERVREKESTCTNESVLFVVLFQARAVSSSFFFFLEREPQIMFSKLTLIISDPGERRALSLHTIKAMVLP